MSPDDYELLKMLCEMYKRLLAAFLEREKIFEEKERLTFKIAESANAITAHNIKTRLASLPIILKMYEAEEENRKKIIKLNRRFKTTLIDIFSTISRTKEMLAIPNLNYCKFDIVELLKKLLRINLNEEGWRIDNSNEPLMIEGDEFLLRNAFSEVISNSKSITDDPDSLIIFIEIEKMNQNGMVRISIFDNGPGVPEKYKKDIFNDFFTYRPGRKAGVGLGLSYVQRVLTAHDGSIKENGYEGRGAVFVIELPIERKL